MYKRCLNFDAGMIFLGQSGRYSLISDCCWHGRFGSYYLWCMMFGSSNVDIMSDIVSLDAWCSCGLVMYDCYMACELISYMIQKVFQENSRELPLLKASKMYFDLSLLPIASFFRFLQIVIFSACPSCQIFFVFLFT